MNRQIRDESKTDPLLILMGAMGEGVDGLIDRQNYGGQVQLVNSTQLPREGSTNPVFALWGIEFGEETDDLFREATLP